MEELQCAFEALDLSDPESVLNYLTAVLAAASACGCGKPVGDPLEISPDSETSYKTFIDSLIEIFQDMRLSPNTVRSYLSSIRGSLNPVTTTALSLDEQLAKLLCLKDMQREYLLGNTLAFEAAVQKAVLKGLKKHR